MKCKECREQLSAYLDGQLREKERQAFEQHVQACPDCAAALSRTRQAVRALADMPPVQPPPDFIVRLNERLDAEDLKRSRQPWRAWNWSYLLRGAATVAVACLAIVLVGRYWQAPVQRTQLPPQVTVPAASTGKALEKDAAVVRQARTPQELKKELPSAPAPQPEKAAHTGALKASRPAAVPAEAMSTAEPGMSASGEQEKPAADTSRGRSDKAPEALQKKSEAQGRAMQAPMPQEWKGDRSSITSPATFVIKDARAWAELWHRHDPEAAVPDVDFSKKMAVAVFQGQEKSSTCAIRITGILKENNTTRILYSCSQASQEEETPKPSSFHIKIIQRSEGSVIFKKTDR